MNTETSEQKSLGLIETFKILLGASKGFWLINMVNFGDGIAYFGILTLLTRFLGTRVGMSDQITGISVSAFTGFVTFFMFGGGYVSDKLGVRKALTVSLLLLGIGRVILLIAPQLTGFSYAGAWTGLLFVALGSGVLQPALYAGIKE
ncbi:MAG: MFS transporter, partial [Ignavibacteria bacterium]|nr:MFS transporter [Ignavibacteria bacterium]